MAKNSYYIIRWLLLLTCFFQHWGDEKIVQSLSQREFRYARKTPISLNLTKIPIHTYICQNYCFPEHTCAALSILVVQTIKIYVIPLAPLLFLTMVKYYHEFSNFLLSIVFRTAKVSQILFYFSNDTFLSIPKLELVFNVMHNFILQYDILQRFWLFFDLFPVSIDSQFVHTFCKAVYALLIVIKGHFQVLPGCVIASHPRSWDSDFRLFTTNVRQLIECRQISPEPSKKEIPEAVYVLFYNQSDMIYYISSTLIWCNVKQTKQSTDFCFQQF